MANVFHAAHKGSLLLSPHFHGPEDSSVIEKCEDIGHGSMEDGSYSNVTYPLLAIDYYRPQH